MELLARIAELSAPPALIEVGFMERLRRMGFSPPPYVRHSAT